MFKTLGILAATLLIISLIYIGTKKGGEVGDNLTDGGKTTDEMVRFPCTNPAFAKIEKVGDFIARIFPAKPDPYDRPDESAALQTTTFSLEELKDIKAKPKAAMFFAITRPNRAKVVGVAAKLQVCDKDNMMESPTGLLKENPVLIDRQDNLALYLHLYQGNEPTVAGDYRLDGYLYSGNKWHLVARFDKITLTE